MILSPRPSDRASVTQYGHEPAPSKQGLLHRYFIAPLRSSDNPPWFDARGIAVGLAVGFAVPIGLQMIVLGLLRIVFRFNAVAAFAFTWVNNPLTLLPMYYGYYYIGSMLLGSSDYMTAESFRQMMAPILHTQYFWESVTVFSAMGHDIVVRWSVTAVLVAAISATFGYIIGHRVQKIHCMRKAKALGLSYEAIVRRCEVALASGAQGAENNRGAARAKVA